MTSAMQKSKMRRFLLMTAATLSLQANFQFARAQDASAGADGVELELVPVDTGTDCSSIILKGTHRFEGTAFIMPRVLVGITKENEDLFQISPDENGGYLLSLGLYFPESNTDLGLRAGRSNLFLHGCNVEAALHQINKGATGGKGRVDKLARPPIRNVEVMIDGVKDRACLGAGGSGKCDETSILNYEGIDHTFEFHLTPAEKEGLLRRLSRKQGISIRVNMKFAARSNDGAMFVDVDLESLANHLQTDLGGKYAIATGDLKFAVNRALSDMKINIRTEAGSGKNPSVDKISENIMGFILSNVADAGSGAGTLDVAKPESSSSIPPLRLPSPSSPSSVPPLGPVGGGPISAPAPAPAPAPGPSDTVGSAIEALSPVSVKVDAVVSLLKSNKRRSINFTNSSALQTYVYTTPVNLQVRLQDPDVYELYVRSSETPSAMPGEISAGDEMTIAVSKAIVESIDWTKKNTYLTVSQLGQVNASSFFPDILADSFILHNEETKQGFMAVGKTAVRGWLGTYFTPQRHFWIRTQAYPNYNVKKEVAVPSTVDGLKGLALQVSFSKVGVRRFALAELLQDNAYWSAEFDDVGGKILLKAKRDLGYMTIIGAAPVKKEERVMDQVIEEIREAGKEPVRSEPERVRRQAVVVERLAYQLSIGRPSDRQGVRVLTPISQSPAPSPVTPK